MQFDRLKRKRLGDILVDEGLVTKEFVIGALHEHQKTKRLLSDVLIDNGHIGEYDLAKALVTEQQLPFVELSNHTVHKDLLAEFPADFLHRAALVPLDRFGAQIAFACQELPGADVAEELRARAPEGCYFFVALSAEIRRLLREFAPLGNGASQPEPRRAGEARRETSPRDEGRKAPPRDDAEIREDTAWKVLFDSANAAVMADLKPEGSTAED